MRIVNVGAALGVFSERLTARLDMGPSRDASISSSSIVPVTHSVPRYFARGVQEWLVMWVCSESGLHGIRELSRRSTMSLLRAKISHRQAAVHDLANEALSARVEVTGYKILHAAFGLTGHARMTATNARSRDCAKTRQVPIGPHCSYSRAALSTPSSPRLWTLESPASVGHLLSFHEMASDINAVRCCPIVHGLHYSHQPCRRVKK
jgi:hypothetical protein